MRKIQFLILVVVGLAVFAGVGNAQRKTAKKPSARKPAIKIIPTLDVRAAREKTADKLEKLNRFLELVGPMAIDLEANDKRAREFTFPRELAQKHNRNKEAVILGIRGFRDGLAVLESEFRTKPSLKPYLAQIGGITNLATDAEDLAVSGSFIASKEPLREIVKKLTDVLTVMPNDPI